MFGAALAVGAAASAASAALVSNGGTGAVVFGVASIGAPANPGGPVFIHNNFTGLQDVLSSPGNGWLTADTSIPNNIQENSGVLPGFGVRIGGGNANGPFGVGAAKIDAFGNVGYLISDTAPAGGSGSYLIASSITQYTSVTQSVGSVGAFLGLKGRLISPASSVAISLRIHISDTAGVFNGIVSPPMVIGIGGGLNNVALGDFAGHVLNTITGEFAAFSLDATPILNIPAGDVLTVRTTLTAIGDPSTIESLSFDDPLLDSLITGSGATRPDFLLSQTVDSSTVPAPGALLTMGVFSLAARRRSRRA